MKQIAKFNHEMFGTIRTMVDEKGETFFVGIDVATALGYSKPRNSVAEHVSPEDKTTALIQGAGSNYKSKAVLINESGLYALIFGSKLPSAKAFKKWVTSEVLPQIRKTGGYIPTKDMRTGEPLSDTQIIRTAENILRKTISDKNLAADNCFTVSDIARLLDMNAQELNYLLVDWGVQFWNGCRYKLTPDYAGKGLTQDRNFHYYGLDGRKKYRTYMVWTRQGLDFMKKLFFAADGRAYASQHDLY